jgi:4'-phosphopantetheinyl transferase
MASCLLQRMLIHSLFSVSFSQVLIPRSSSNKPFFNVPHLPRWNYNVSHHGDMVTIASDELHRIGVDVMHLAERPPRGATEDEYLATFRKYFTPTEWTAISGSLETFYTLWTLKEAYAKAIGVGMGYQLNRLDFHLQPGGIRLLLDGEETVNWQFLSHEFPDNHLVSIALERPERPLFPLEWIERTIRETIPREERCKYDNLFELVFSSRLRLEGILYCLF